MKTLDMEVAVATWLNPRDKIIVPNVSWGMVLDHRPLHECDLLVLTKSGYLWEIEIKVSKSDLIRDKEKSHRHRHNHPAIRRLYFAIPHNLAEHSGHIPPRAGIVAVYNDNRCLVVRKPKECSNYRVSESDKIQLMRLGLMRVWALKKKLSKTLDKLKPECT